MAYARSHLRVDSLRVEVRDGLGLDTFYRKLGWDEVGRWPGGIIIGGERRDEVLMQVDLRDA